MIDSYWDLYVAYIDKCVRENDANDFDPVYCEMEWNHTLPQCLFGDQPVGQYLTLKQHAIASALQTLAFEKNCMCGWHKRYLPGILVELARPHYAKQSADLALKMNAHPNTIASRSKTVKVMNNHPNAIANRFEVAKVMNDHPNTAANRVENGARTGATNGKVTSKCVLLTGIATGENFEFSSVNRAARVLGLNSGSLCEVARGKRKQHKGYTAVYL